MNLMLFYLFFLYIYLNNWINAWGEIMKLLILNTLTHTNKTKSHFSYSYYILNECHDNLNATNRMKKITIKLLTEN